MTAELANLEGDRIVLTKVVVHAVSSGIVHIDTCFGVFLCNDVDDTRHRIAAIQGTLCAFHYLDALYVMRVNQSEIVLAANVAMNALAVNENQNIVIAQPVQLHLASHIAFVEGKGCRQRPQYLFYALAAKTVQHLAVNDFCLHRHIL